MSSISKWTCKAQLQGALARKKGVEGPDTVVLAEGRNRVGLGCALVNSGSGSTHKTNRKHRGNGAGRGGRVTGEGRPEMLCATEKHEADWYRMRSITQQNDLDEFLSSAELADTDFTAATHRQNKQQITVPPRPQWDSTTPPTELERREKDSLLHWPRGLVELQEVKDLMAPFERNLEGWRQLWRVIESRDLVVQIADARNPLMFCCEDLERYVKEVDQRRTNLLLVNKANMMTAEQGREVVVVEEEKEELRIRILTVDELEEVFLEHAPIVKDPGSPGKTVVGLSSTINAHIGAKEVSVSSIPGKTKHLQTLLLGEKIVLGDCPGLVFPNFDTAKAELICNCVLPIDQPREFSGPTTLVPRRITQQFLESLYGIKIDTRPFEEGGTGVPTGGELLMAYAGARGFYKTGAAKPDESWAARSVLRDYRRRAGASLGQDHDDDLASEGLPIIEMGEKSLGHIKALFHLGAGAAGALPGWTHLSGRKARTVIPLDNNISFDEARKGMGAKKHFKGRKNIN
ncbi:hypothetical protein C7212DRAFT_360348 [Tuber magnatum]|uniref:G domain-containing protein n=1 Tax=Tuber magnatum TaxID=42249 RepID=A0A317SDV0_9PEZI|nr:hypothetical protein C7212DRAFT_360348 [Tuber magnatum]